LQSDGDLIDMMCKGDRKAFAGLYERYKSAIYGYCMKMLADHAAAEDAAHETFIKMYSNAGQIKDRSSFRSWLFRIARNEVLMHVRRNKTNGTADADSVWCEETPHEIMISLETSQIVSSILQKMKSEYREVFLLREYEQLSYSQIAVIMGDTESSVKSRLFKARQALINKLRFYYQ
jgi:RNA polymerase sigma-70 factor, ECF subfamily